MDEMTYTEQTAVDNAIEMGRPIQMVSPTGKTVAVPTERVQERMAAGYTFSARQMRASYDALEARYAAAL